MSQLSLLGDIMGTMTAQILIGKSHPNDGGIRPEWMVQLSENSRPHVMLHNNINYLARTNKSPSYFEWTPSVENGVEDILLMIALHVIKDKNILDFVSRRNPEILKNRVEVYDIPDEVRESLYQLVRGVDGWPKLAVSIYFRCYLERQFSILEDMSVDHEICMSVRVREKSSWGDMNLKRETGEMAKI